jgi:hypothetical protein
MRALTVTQPWCGLIASGIKRIENRSRSLIRRENIGVPFALHASREIDEGFYARIAEIAPELTCCAPAEWYRLSRITSAVIGVATIDKVFGGWDVESIAEHAEALSDSRGAPLGSQQVRWFFGPVGYVLRDIRALATPVPCRGWQGFWHLTPAVDRAVTEQLCPDHTTRTP